MSSLDVICPHCGVRIVDPESRSAPAPTPGVAPPLPGIVLGGFHLAGSGSGDGSGSSSAFALPTGLATPDPILGVLAQFDTADDPAPETIKPTSPSPAGPAPPGSYDALNGLNLDPPSASPPAPTEPARASGSGDEEVVYVDGPNWPMVMLASYASAVTLALVWWVVIPKFQGRKPDLDGFVAGRPSAEDGTRRDDGSRKVEPAPPIAAANLTGVGQALKVGSLEVTPIDVSRQSVRLRRTSLSGKVENRDGGTGALALRVRVRNASDDTVFAPIDPAFLRDTDTGVSESFVEVGPGRRVYLYPLPVESEWSIVGQDFPELKPGETKETRIVSVADFPAVDGPTTWRIKVRTGAGTTATIGVEVPGGP